MNTFCPRNKYLIVKDLSRIEIQFIVDQLVNQYGCTLASVYADVLRDESQSIRSIGISMGKTIIPSKYWSSNRFTNGTLISTADLLEYFNVNVNNKKEGTMSLNRQVIRHATFVLGTDISTMDADALAGSIAELKKYKKELTELSDGVESPYVTKKLEQVDKALAECWAHLDRKSA